MSDQAATSREPTTRELSAQLVVQLAELAGQEVALAKAELYATARKAGAGLVLGMVAGLLGFTAWLTFVAAAIAGIAVALPAWAATLIIGGGLAALGGVLGLMAARRLSAVSSPMPLTTDSVVRDLREIREKARR